MQHQPGVATRNTKSWEEMIVNDKKGVTWDLTSYFPEFNGPLMRRFKSDLERDIAALKRNLEKIGTLTRENSEKWALLIVSAENVSSRLGHLSSYLGCLESAHAENEDYATERAALVGLAAAYEKGEIDILKTFKRANAGVFLSFCGRPEVKDVAHYLNRLRQRARYTMSPKEEALASDLNVDGFTSWGRLYNKISGKLQFEYTGKDGRVERRPISQWRSLMSHPDREIGRAAFEGGNRAWQGIEDSCAAALNAIAGTRLTLYRHRRIKHFMDQALFGAAVSAATLEAMYQAVFQNLDTARDILKAKAHYFGRKGIWFFEREAPLPLADTKAIKWPQAVDMVHKAFTLTYPALADYFRGALKKRWIESEARPGKRPGAFCTGSSLTGEQRVYMTFNGSLGDVTTLAHEVGHAWHGHLLNQARPFARRYPMTLAETASIFAEHLLIEGLYNDRTVDGSEKLGLLDNELTDAAVFLLDITTRFEFEKAFYQERREGEVSVARLKALMGETQRRIYGDALLDDGDDPYFWASKLHFFITDTSFYNFPYTFGYLLARALFHRHRLLGEEFIPQYESFLMASGNGPVEEVGRQALGIDFTDADFWTQAIRSLKEPLESYRTGISEEVER